MKLIRIKNEEHLKQFETKDKKVRSFDATTTTPVLFYREGKLICSNEWFVNENNELIYKIKENDWVNLKMYEEGKSYAKDLFVAR